MFLLLIWVELCVYRELFTLIMYAMITNFVEKFQQLSQYLQRLAFILLNLL